MEQEREIEILIRIKKDFPKNWTDGQINFFLNESSFCLGESPFVESAFCPHCGKKMMNGKG